MKNIFNIAVSLIAKWQKILMFLAITGILFYIGGGCASTGYPSGGPKDEAPPVVIRSTPPINALNFKGKEIVVSFDEIIVLKDVSQKLVVSPPVNKQPAVTTRGRDLVVKFDEDLQLNMTYTLDFSDAISDNNENNILQNFRFSFSTGTDIDSLSMSGHLFDATNLTPVAGAFVMVYKNLSDTAFRTQVPMRLAKTDQNGAFSVQNLAEGEYKIYALEDGNRNYFYDQPGERIAWLSQLIEPSIGYRERVDSIAPDSVHIHEYRVFLPDSLQLFMFKEDNDIQYLKDRKRPVRNKIDFIFNRALDKPLTINPIKSEVKNDWFVYENSIFNDSITLWITDSTLIKGDSLFVEIGYMVRDSLNQLVLKNDTLNMYFFDTGTTSQRQRQRGNDEPKETILPALQPQSMKRTLEILGELDIMFPTPIADYDISAMRLYHLVDTIQTPVEFKLEQDSLRLRRYLIQHQWKPGEKYLFKADSAAFTDVYGIKTDSIHNPFNVKTVESYGIMLVSIVNPQSNWLLQLLDRQDKPVRQAYVSPNGKNAFQYLPPGEYFLRIVEDVNMNGKWDTGDLSNEIQPERIMYYPVSQTIRANWDVHLDEDWNPLEFDIYDFINRHRASKKGR